jgi:cyclic-di-AMP phosphodiesterase PgpH
MPRDPDNLPPTTRTGSLSRSVRARRAHPGRFSGMGAYVRLLDALAQPSLGMGVMIAAVFALVCTGFVIWARTQPLVAVGRIMDETRLVRVPMNVPDEAATAQAKELARQATPRVFRPDHAVLTAVVDPLETLPKTLASAADLTAVDPLIREEYALTPEILAALRSQAVDGEPSQAWRTRVRALHALLQRRPFLEAQTWQRALQEGATTIVSLVDHDREDVPKSDLVNMGDKERFARAADEVARAAGFTGPLHTLVSHRLVNRMKPTFTFDEATTALHQTWAANAVKTIERVSSPGQVIFQRGYPLTQAQADLYRAEQRHFNEHGRTSYGLARNIAVFAACFAITLALTGYTFLFCPRVRKNASRIGGVALTLGVALGVAAIGTAQAPGFAAVFSIAPTLFVALLLAIAYDRRSALAYALLHALLVCVALRESVGHMAVMITGIACVVWAVKEIRDRNSLFRASVFTAVGVGLATVIFSLIERPLTPDVIEPVMKEIALEAVLASAGAVVVGGITLFMLPVIERAFNVTTGMTLIDLRDPKQPLLKELQFRAPGTYNHSLNVASIAEAAADAIGGDSLLTYVGALYHDVGKMNKPEYFVENQVGGSNKHDKLSPAMSLLLVIGHVKDGMELGREFRLPGKVQHFIEAHHGTTLVEFFFHRARQLALKGKDGQDIEPDDTYVPDEFEYRYPGPKPRTKEVAILMIADAVESAARAMAEPTPSRIDALVRTIANKRLLDGQFDDCELTLKELHLIVESISRTVTSMYHGRIAYPQGEIETPAQEQRA